MTDLNPSTPNEDDGLPQPLPLLFNQPAANGNGQDLNDGVIFKVAKVEGQDMLPANNAKPAQAPLEMFSTRFNGFSGFPVVADLPTDFIDNLSGKRHGNMSPHMYHNSALPAWEKVTQHRDYYPAHSDTQIIHDNETFFQALGDELRKESGMDLAYIEMGVGAEYALNHKTIPMIKALGATDVGLLDYSSSAVGLASFHLAEHMPEIKRHQMMANFNTQSFGGLAPKDKRKIYALWGCTMGNFESPAAIDVQEMLGKYLGHYLAQMDKGDILLLSVDLNLDPKSLHRAYNEIFHDWVKKMPPYLAQNFKGSGYDTVDHQYSSEWNAEHNVFLFGFKPRKDGTIKWNGYTVPFVGNRTNVHLNSRRFIQSTLNKAYDTTVNVDVVTKERKKFQIYDILPDRRRYISVQALQVV